MDFKEQIELILVYVPLIHHAHLLELDFEVEVVDYQKPDLMEGQGLQNRTLHVQKEQSQKVDHLERGVESLHHLSHEVLRLNLQHQFIESFEFRLFLIKARQNHVRVHFHSELSQFLQTESDEDRNVGLLLMVDLLQDFGLLEGHLPKVDEFFPEYDFLVIQREVVNLVCFFDEFFECFQSV